MGERGNRIGRPTKFPNAGERVPLGLRVTPDIKLKLDAAAEKNGRSQSQEAEFRLEQSFGRDLAYSMVASFTAAGERRAYNRGLKKEWISDPDCFRAGMFGVVEVIDAHADRCARSRCHDGGG